MYRAQLTDECLSGVLRISTVKVAPDFDALVKKGENWNEEDSSRKTEIFLKHKGRTKLYDTIEKAPKDLANRGYTVQTIRMPKTMMDQLRQLIWRKAGR